MDRAYRTMRERFSKLLERLGLAAHVDRVYPLIVEHYSEPSRRYHTLGHVRDCLGELDKVRGSLRDPDAAELALWFHDIVYDPSADDNELRSALMFDRELGVQLPTDRADRVHDMIMATAHPSEPEDNDARFVVDIDLSSFALPRDEFLRNTGSLRKEFEHLTDSEFQIGTLAFFEKILARSGIYLTEYFKSHCEQQARRNIATLVDILEREQAAGSR